MPFVFPFVMTSQVQLQSATKMSRDDSEPSSRTGIRCAKPSRNLPSLPVCAASGSGRHIACFRDRRCVTWPETVGVDAERPSKSMIESTRPAGDWSVAQPCMVIHAQCHPHDRTANIRPSITTSSSIWTSHDELASMHERQKKRFQSNKRLRGWSNTLFDTYTTVECWQPPSSASASPC